MLYLKALAAAILAMGSRGALAATPTAEYYSDFNSQPGTQKLRVCKHADFVDCVILGGAINTCYNVPSSWNDVISSIRVPAFVSQCVIYEHASCTGQSLRVGTLLGVDNLKDYSLNDKVSSFRCSS
ncbi:hypothetical protein VTJ04DRAFT_313 [Mycothermus thermophilus]|uniref:uncharacterized protein n=1 Tax=Humicola insolens TaxID=85995 RepID=UPI0037432B23